ncbi:MAG: hypothetical protein DRR08_17735 [Candidatus Parabeggiatoa sp. nov. 2]|nr:MAG: hypothetical protein DRR08_17735 [Gammaproteobacteria bacterium]
MKYCFVFICQQGELEIKSMLLATSLKRYLRGDYELVAALPQPESRWGTVSAKTRTLMQTLGIRSVPITNGIDENYPIGNKVACLGIDTPAEKIVFLDSDILCLRELSPDTVFAAPFNAKPADLATFTQNIALWQQVYDLFNLPLPKERVISSTSGELMLPYFNAGVIAVQNGRNLGPVWEKCCRRIDAEPSITNKRPWLDQIALPIAVKQLNLNYNCFDERFNFPAHLKPLKSKIPSNLPLERISLLSTREAGGFSLPFLCHYHWPSVIRREPLLNQLVTELAEAYPLLKQLILYSNEWAQLLKPYTLQKAPSIRYPSFLNPLQFLPRKPRRFLKPLQFLPAEAIITGIPRSGTSYLCRLLHSVPDCIVISEPTQIFEPLNNNLTYWQVATFYQELRRDILDGKPVENKLLYGQVIEDTAIIDRRTHYQPKVSRPDFLLATKNTLAYMARLPQLKQVLPTAPIIACVRHPLDTIASWKTSFPHLKQASVTEFPVGHVNDPFLPQWQRQRLAEIAATPIEALKRALLWRYLAETVLMNAHQLIVVRYEELVTEPVTVLKTLLRQIPNAPPLSGTGKPSTVRQKREVLDDEDWQAIGDVCGECMAELGYTN